MQSWADGRFFLAVARGGSFTAASRRLGVNQSTVSRRIAELERAIGGELFHRTPREFALSELAVRLVPRAERVEQAMAELARAAEAGDEPSGTVRVATTEELVSAVLVPAFDDLRREFPRIQLELIGGGRVVSIERGAADAALRAVRPSRGELVSRNVASLRYSAYASRGYLRRHRGVALAELDWLALDDPGGRLPEARWVDDLLGARRAVLRTTNTLDLAAAAARGQGVALLPDALAARYDNLAQLDETAPPIVERRLWLVTHRSLSRVARVRAVMGWIAAACARA